MIQPVSLSMCFRLAKTLIIIPINEYDSHSKVLPVWIRVYIDFSHYMSYVLKNVTTALLPVEQLYNNTFLYPFYLF